MHLVKNDTCPTGELIMQRTDDYMKSLMFFVDLRKEGRKLKISTPIKVKKEICLQMNSTRLTISINGTTVPPYITNGIMLNEQIEQYINSNDLSDKVKLTDALSQFKEAITSKEPSTKVVQTDLKSTLSEVKDMLIN